MKMPYSPWADNVTRLAGMHGLTHQQLAELLGLSPQTISLWRSGKRQPSAAPMMAMSKLFHIDLVALSDQPFRELLPLVADQDRFDATELAIRQHRRPLKAVSPVEREVINRSRKLDPSAKGKQGDS